MATFLIHAPNDETRVIKLEKKTVTLGRRDDNDIIVDDVFVSRNHAEIVFEKGKYKLRDRQSRYGTFVNGLRITESTLNYGDEIQVGNIVITFVDEKTLDQIPAKKPPTRRIDLQLDVSKQLNDLERKFSEDASQDTIFRTMAELRSTFTNFERKLIDAERSKEIASTLCEVGKIINFVFDVNVLLNLLMDLALKITQARRGFIMLHDAANNRLNVKVARNMGGELEAAKAGGISQSLAWQTFKSGKLIATNDASTDERFQDQASVINYAIGAVICVPLVARERGKIGVLYLDNPATMKRFDQSDIEFMSSFANQSAIAIENAQLYEKIKEEEKMRARLQRFFSPAVVDRIMIEEGGFKLGGEHRIATVLFCDIRGYTSLTEKIDVMIAVEILNDFLSSMSEEVFIYEGTLDKFIGDCVMAIFGAPVAHEDDPLRAVKAALGMRRRVRELKQQWLERIKMPDIAGFDIGIGVHTGEVIAGNIGNINRMEYTVVSAAVNLASRLEGAADRGQILISRETHELVKERVDARELPPVKLKNISRPVTVFEVLDLKS